MGTSIQVKVVWHHRTGQPMKPVDTRYLDDADRRTLGESADRREAIRGGDLRVFFRPGDRTQPGHPNHIPDRCFVGVIAHHGSHRSRTPPTLSLRRAAMVIARDCRPIHAWPLSALRGAGLSPADHRSLLRYLRRKYPRETLDLSSRVTRIEVVYPE
ncbi:MAG: hypothetical protein H6739_26610 [Alphaproteobacteria bacterium]|nr:hypothetical protein [Alphaproteobacteria bacterium]